MGILQRATRPATGRAVLSHPQLYHSRPPNAIPPHVGAHRGIRQQTVGGRPPMAYPRDVLGQTVVPRRVGPGWQALVAPYRMPEWMLLQAVGRGPMGARGLAIRATGR